MIVDDMTEGQILEALEETNYRKEPMDFEKSVNFTGYYKGYKVQATVRDEKHDVKPLLEKSMKAIDWMSQNGFKPSWNDDTNVSVTPPSAPKTDYKDVTEGQTCEKCNAPMKVSKKGNLYCSAKCWLPESER